MMREIGSEFWDVPTSTKEVELFPTSTQWYLSGRSALHAIINELKSAKSVSLPSWCCDSIVRPFVTAGFSISFYPVYWNNGLIQEIDSNCDVLFLMDYFGYSTPIPNLNGFKGKIICDSTHSIFSSRDIKADYYFGSLRKWFGVWTGGYVWTRDGHRINAGKKESQKYIDLREKAMAEKASFIAGLSDEKCYLKKFADAERLLDQIGIASAAERDVLLVQRLDLEAIKKKRRANAEVLRSAFSDWLLFLDLDSKDTPLFVPIIVPNGKRNTLRQNLIDNGIYCPVHWPINEGYKFDERTLFIYENELSLVCDQRYTEEDMQRMVKTITAFL